jgi:hypothetical protein
MSYSSHESGSPASGGWIYAQSGGSAHAGVPGWTISAAANGTILWANTYLNLDFAWNTGGTMNQSQGMADVRTVATHEFGHWLRLLHPSQCGTVTNLEKAAAMTPDWTTKWNINGDDDSGIYSIYPTSPR